MSTVSTPTVSVAGAGAAGVAAAETTGISNMTDSAAAVEVAGTVQTLPVTGSTTAIIAGLGSALIAAGWLATRYASALLPADHEG